MITNTEFRIVQATAFIAHHRNQDIHTAKQRIARSGVINSLIIIKKKSINTDSDLWTYRKIVPNFTLIQFIRHSSHSRLGNWKSGNAVVEMKPKYNQPGVHIYRKQIHTHQFKKQQRTSFSLKSSR